MTVSVSMLRVAAFAPRSEVNGPGVRAVVWVQGCPRVPICPGCYNPAFLDMEGAPAEIVSVERMAERILAVEGLDGVTFSGGEPFAQARALAELGATLRSRGLTVVVFTGRTIEDLRASRDAGEHALLAMTDLLVDGPYDRTRPSRLPLQSSANQRLHFLSGRVRPIDVAEGANDAVEISIGADGSAHATGLIDANLLRRLRSDHVG